MKDQRFLKELKKRVLIMDGAMGTLLHQRGLKSGQAPEELNITNPDIVESVHRDYICAGAHIVLTNTFGATRKKLAEFGLENKLVDINRAGVLIARKAQKKSHGFVAGDIGPLGSYLTPLGPLSWDEAYANFSEQVKALASANPDLIIIETMSDIRELKAALCAVKDYFKGPVFSHMTFTEDGVTVTGTDPLSFITVAEALGSDGIGINCGVGPKNLLPIIEIIAKNTHLPLSVKPNRGLPQLINRETIYPGTIDEFVFCAKKFVSLGVNMIGGCCGTDPIFIQATATALAEEKPRIRKRCAGVTRFCSRTHTIQITHTSPLTIIGERINPTGRKFLQQELLNNDFTTVRKDAIEQVRAGSQMIDVNMGVPGRDEKQLMVRALKIVQASTSAPICIDTSSTDVLEEALKHCEGKPLINSVTADLKKLNTVLPLAKRYGAGIIGLVINKKGIPKNFTGRIHNARIIIKACQKYGIPKEDIIIDNLSLAASTDALQAGETLKAIKYMSKIMKYKTILGISNISYGLPNRPALNNTFLNLARKNGLACAIINPLLPRGVNDSFALKVLLGKDPHLSLYLKQYASSASAKDSALKHSVTSDQKDIRRELYQAVLNGMQESIYPLIDRALQEHIPSEEITNRILLPALEEVGEKFIRKQFFLPQVLLCADTLQKAFEYIQSKNPGQVSRSRGTILLATVEGDIHDIGKNIVKSVFENHGWKVFDLGKNVASEKIIEQAGILNPDIIGLSALMTTTMVHMETVITLKNKRNLTMPVVIGGAAVTQSYADAIKADGYASDVITAVRLVEHLCKKLS